MYSVLIPKVVTKPTKLVDKVTGEIVLEQKITITHPALFAPIAASILLGHGKKPLEAGEYECLPESLVSGKYDRPEFRPVIGKQLRKITP